MEVIKVSFCLQNSSHWYCQYFREIFTFVDVFCQSTKVTQGPVSFVDTKRVAFCRFFLALPSCVHLNPKNMKKQMDGQGRGRGCAKRRAA